MKICGTSSNFCHHTYLSRPPIHSPLVMIPHFVYDCICLLNGQSLSRQTACIPLHSTRSHSKSSFKLASLEVLSRL